MSKHEYVIEASARANVGKGASRRLRHANEFPAIIYGGTKEPANISLKHHQFLHLLENESFFASIITMNVDGVAEDVVIKALQRHPAKPRIMHADFQRVDANKALHVKIPLHFINEATSVGFKAGGLVSHLMTELEIACLPRFLPEYIEVDISKLDLGDSLHISDLQLPEGVSSVSLTHGESGDLAVVAITAPKKAEEPTPAEAAAAAAAAAAPAKGGAKAPAKAAPKAPAKK
ncbi:MAG: 50S ribosomal protein L25/general stress protein Ctc [Pseudomonadota bacterium]